MQSKSRKAVLHAAVSKVLKENAENIESLDHFLEYRIDYDYILRDVKAKRNLIKISTDGPNTIVFTELTPNNVHEQWQNFYEFKIQRHMLYSPEERQQIKTLAELIKAFCEERMYNEELFVTKPRQQYDDCDGFDY